VRYTHDCQPLDERPTLPADVFQIEYRWRCPNQRWEVIARPLGGMASRIGRRRYLRKADQ